MADLVRGRYHATNPLWAYEGQAVNASQSDIALRSNLDWGPGMVFTDGAAFATGVATAVAIPVENGDVFTKVLLPVGATAEATGTHAWAALYSGLATPALLAQSADLTGATAVSPASAVFAFTLASAVGITQAVAPNGFIYASIMVAATTPPTAKSYSLAVAVAYQEFANGPLKQGAITHGSALVGTAPATIASPAAQAITPVVYLQ